MGIARTNEGDEFLAYYPELGQDFLQVRSKLRGLQYVLEHGSSGATLGSQIERFVTKMRHDSCSAVQILQEAKIQDLEVAIDQTPEVAADLLETVKLSELKVLTNGITSKVAVGNTVADDLEDTDVQVADTKRGNRFQRLASDSSSESENEQKLQAGTAPNRFSMLGDESADDSDSATDEQ